jgi:hypothetical protein
MSLRVHPACVIALSLVAWAAACGKEPTGPQSAPLIAIGDTVSGSLAPGAEEVLYRFNAQQDSTYAVFFQVLSGQLELDVQDPTRALLLAVAIADSGSGGVLDHVSGAFVPFSTAPYVIAVRRTGPLTGGRFRFLVYRVRATPEQVPARFTLGDTIAGETLETIADLDQFVFAGQAGQEVIGYAQALAGPTGARLALNIGQPGVTSVGGDSSLELQATGRFLLPATQDYTAMIRAAGDLFLNPPGYHGTYQFQVRTIDHAPESVPAAVVLGDTVSGERLDYVGDIDEFSLPGGGGREINVFLQGTSGGPADNFVLDVRNPGDTSFQTRTISDGASAGLLTNATGRFTVPSVGSGPVLRIRGEWDRYVFADRGPYHLFVYPVNRAPEHVSVSVAIGDSVGEDIELPGDVDEYILTLPDSALVNYVLWRQTAQSTGAVQLEITGPDSGTPPTGIAVSGPAGSVAGTGVGLRLPGTYQLRVSGSGSGDGGYFGEYRLQVLPIDSLPEQAPESLAIGDSITETLAPAGDLDRFVFFGAKGEHVDVRLQALSGTGMVLAVLSPSGAVLAGVFLGDPHSGRLDFTETGWYRVGVGPAQGGTVLEDTGTYRVTIYRVSGAPETAPDSVLVADSVWTESLDFAGDLDEFSIVGAPGTEVALFFLAGSNTTLDVIDSATSDVIVQTPVPGATPRFRLPASRRARVRVYAPGPTNVAVGAYWFFVYPVDRAPELVSPTVVLDDTVAGETIAPIVDVDEFSFDGTSGQVVTVLFDTPTGAGFPGYELQFVDPVADSVLGSAISVNPSSTFGDVHTGPFTLPRTGTFVLRVQAVDNTALGDRPYRFLVR